MKSIIVSAMCVAAFAFTGCASHKPCPPCPMSKNVCPAKKPCCKNPPHSCKMKQNQ